MTRAISDEERRLTDREKQEVVDNMGFVWVIAVSLARSKDQRDDYAQAGAMGLFRAIRLCGPTGTKDFGSQASSWIRGAIREEKRRRANLIAIPHYLQCSNRPGADAARAKYAPWIERATGLASLSPNDSERLTADPPRDPIEVEDERNAVRMAMASLTETERTVVLRHLEGETLKTIGEDMGKYAVWAFNVKHRAYAKLREMLADYA